MSTSINSQLSYQNGIFPPPKTAPFPTADDFRARTNDLIAPNIYGVILYKWLSTPGKTGTIRAQELLNQFSQNPKSGFIWGFSEYLKNNPTGNIQVDALFQSELFDALGIDISVISLQSLLKHIVMQNEKQKN